jgi:hypothetical protein
MSNFQCWCWPGKALTEQGSWQLVNKAHGGRWPSWRGSRLSAASPPFAAENDAGKKAAFARDAQQIGDCDQTTESGSWNWGRKMRLG